jgi:maltooligosyltrehalose trehalohydrolase
VGAEVTAHGVNFRVWAPERHQVEVILAEGLEKLAPIALRPEADGYFSATVETGRAGTLYWYRLDGEADLLPDPASRFQPEGPMGPSEVIDPDVFTWTDLGWPGVSWKNQVLYEMHVGAFTREGHVARGDRAATGTRRPRHHCHRDDARRGLHRPLRLGVRRR